MGHVGEDPKITSLNDNTRCANFSLATSERWKDKASGEMKSITEWHRISVFNQNLVSVIEQYLKKGDPVHVEGEIRSRKYTNKEGREVTLTEILLKSFKGELILLKEKGDSAQEPTRKTKPRVYEAPFYDELNDDIPF